jgi:hypothetical protein
VKSSQNWDFSNVGDIPTDKIQRNIREVTVYLDNDIRQMVAILSRYAPLEMLKLACWEEHRVLSSGSDEEIRLASALVRFLQNAYCLAGMGPATDRNIPPKEYRRLTELFEDLFRRCCRYIDNTCLAARNAAGGVKGSVLSAYQDSVMEFCFPTPMELDEIPRHVRSLRLSLQPFNDAISQTFTGGLDGLLTAFSALVTQGRTGLDTLEADSRVYKKDMEQKLKELRALTDTYAEEKELVDQVVRCEHWEERVRSLLGRRDGYDLYEVTRYASLAPEDLALLSVPLCSDESDASLYPMDDRVSASRPFLEAAGHFFCFDTNHLLDDLPRIVKEQVLAKGVLSAEEWEKIEREQQVMQPVTMIHALFGSTGFVRNTSGFDALFDFSDSQVGLNVLPPLPVDPLLDGRASLLAFSQGRQTIARAKTQRTPVIIVDENHVDDYPTDLVDNVLFLSFPQLAGLSQDPDTLRACKEALGLVPPWQEDDDELDTAESILRDESEPDEDVPVEDEGEPDEPDEPDDPDFSILNGETVDEDQVEEKHTDDELDEDDTKEMIDPHDDDELPPQEKHEETNKPYSFFTLLSEIAGGREEKPEKPENPPQEGNHPDWPAKPATEDIQPDLFQGREDILEAAAETVEDKTEADVTPPTEPEEEQPVPAAQAEATGEPTQEVSVEKIPGTEAVPEAKEESPMAPPVGHDVIPSEVPVQETPATSSEETIPSDHPAPAPETLVEETPKEPEVVDALLDGKQIPSRLRDALVMLKTHEGRFFTWCKEGDPSLLSASASLIDKALDAQRMDGKDKMFTISPFGLTVILSAGRDDQVSTFDRRANIGAIMYADKKDDWGCVTLEYDREGHLIKASEEEIKRQSYSAGDWKYVSTIGERLLAKRKKA